MMTGIHNIEFNDFSYAIPCFVCIAFMPFTYSISDGIMLAYITYVLVQMCTGNWKKLSPAMYILAALFVLRYAFL